MGGGDHRNLGLRWRAVAGHGATAWHCRGGSAGTRSGLHSGKSLGIQRRTRPYWKPAARTASGANSNCIQCALRLASPQALQALRQRGLRLLFLTNNSSKSRRQYLRKFQSLGIQAAPEEVVPTSYTAAAYLRSISFAQRALVLGTEGMAHEMEEAGIDYCTWEQLCSSSGSSGSDSGSMAAGAGSGGSGSELAELERKWTAEGFGGLQLDPDIGAVVVGWCVGQGMLPVCRSFPYAFAAPSSQHSWREAVNSCSTATPLPLCFDCGCSVPAWLSSWMLQYNNSLAAVPSRQGPHLQLRQALPGVDAAAGAAWLPLCGHQSGLGRSHG